MDAFIRSKPSIRKFTSDDLFNMGKQAYNSGLWTVAIDSMKCALDLVKTANGTTADPQEYLNLFNEEPVDATEMEQKYNWVIENHDQRLLRRGSRANGVRHKTRPVGNKLTKKEVKQIAKREKQLAQAEMLREDKLEDPLGNKRPDHYEKDEQNYRIDYQKELLCAGYTFRVILFTIVCLIDEQGLISAQGGKKSKN